MTLDVDALSHRYSGSPSAALDGVALQAFPGEVLGLLGPNGAGKSTLMNLLAGDLDVQHGRIVLDGRDLAEVRRADPHAVSLAPQQDAFYPMLTVRENVDCFAAAAGIDAVLARRRADAALERTRLEPHAQRRAALLSGGLKRRLNLALALLVQPRLLLLDEPTAGVDPQSRAFLLTTLQALAGEGTIVVFSSHLMGEVEAIAARVVILDHGHVLRAAPLAEMLADDRATMHLDVNGLPAAAIDAVVARFGRIERNRSGLHLHLATGYAPTAVLAALEAAGARVDGASFGRTSLEQTFLALTRETLRDD